MAQSNENPQIWNVPNQLSAARLGLAVIVFVLIPLELYWVALVGFVVAAGTDWVDGWWARKYGQVTQLGRMLDPFCDKFLICGTFILLAVQMQTYDDFTWYNKVSGWVAVIVVARELLVTGLRSFIEQAGGDFSAKMAGKLKMVFQCIAAGACLVALAQVSGEPKNLTAWVNGVVIVFVWLTVISTLYSGYEYVMAAVKMIDFSAKANN